MTLWTENLDFEPVDASALVEFARCPRAWFIHYRLRKVPPTPSVALSFGSALHEALADIGCGRTPDLQAIAGKWGLDKVQDRRDSLMLKEAIESYKQEYETYTLDTGLPAVECSFALPLTDDIVWCGRIDRIVRLPNGALAVQDYKTSSIDSSLFWNEFEVSIAQTGYLWAASQALGEDITTFVITAFITRTTNPQSRWVSRLFIREPTMFEEWKQFVTQTVRSFPKAEPEEVLTNGRFANLTSCYAHKFGACAYAGICRTPPSARMYLVTQTLADDTFSPLKK